MAQMEPLYLLPLKMELLQGIAEINRAIKNPPIPRRADIVPATITSAPTHCLFTNKLLRLKIPITINNC